MIDVVSLNELYRKVSLEVCALEENKEYQHAIDLLEEFGKRHAEDDKEGWLKNAIASRQADLFAASGNLAASLKKRRLVAVATTDRFFYMVNSHTIAALLQNLGQPQQALEELRHTWSVISEPMEVTDLGTMAFYVDLCQTLNEEVLERDKLMARQIIEKSGLTLGLNDQHNAQRLREAMSVVQRRNVNQRPLLPE